MNLQPTGRPTVAGTHCPCGNQRRASRRCCRACERYFWRRNEALLIGALARELSREVRSESTAEARWLELRRLLSVPGVNGRIEVAC